MSNTETNPLVASRSFGWWSLLCWLSLGIALEAMHGFKVGWYLDVVNDGRRLQLTLAHTHGTLLAVLNILFAISLRDSDASAAIGKASKCLKWAAILMPLGFLGDNHPANSLHVGRYMIGGAQGSVPRTGRDGPRPCGRRSGAPRPSTS